MKTFNLTSDEWDGTRDREGWRGKGALVGQRIGGELIGATMSEVEPGNRLWPYHTHYLNEEWVIALRGEPPTQQIVHRLVVRLRELALLISFLLAYASFPVGRRASSGP
ncbi:MAG: hypothetical protein H0U05_02555 [Actinobacteria bacterium]|nr:hypothetical protein [Actinomycetota bacterium]